MQKADIAIMFSGGTDSLAVYALAFSGRLPQTPNPQKIHLLNMLNGMGRFPDFTRNRFKIAQEIIEKQYGNLSALPESILVELDMGRLFQGLWLDRYEELMPQYGGKNLVCVACKLGMHTRAILYCHENKVTHLTAGYAKRQNYYPEQTPVFMEKTRSFSDFFGITTFFPIYDEFTDEMITRHLLEEYGLPSTGGGERKCLFCQTLTTAGEKEIGSYLDAMIPRAKKYIDYRLAGHIKKAAECFPPGR